MNVSVHLTRPGVELVGPIERDSRDEIVNAVKDIGVGHAALPYFFRLGTARDRAGFVAIDAHYRAADKHR
jgi:hypothetical protein